MTACGLSMWTIHYFMNLNLIPLVLIIAIITSKSYKFHSNNLYLLKNIYIMYELYEIVNTVMIWISII